MPSTDELSLRMLVCTPTKRMKIILTAMFLAFSVRAQAEGPEAGTIKLPEQIEFKGLSGSPQIATLYGDPTKAGVFVQRVKFPAGLKVMPHSHPDSPRTIAVLSGTLYFAFGESWDETKLKAFPAGTFFTEPANPPHYVWAKDGDVIVQLTSIGPTGTIPVKLARQ